MEEQTTTKRSEVRYPDVGGWRKELEPRGNDKIDKKSKGARTSRNVSILQPDEAEQENEGLNGDGNVFPEQTKALK